jgi:DNA-binding IclR family transcriptional regulator
MSPGHRSLSKLCREHAVAINTTVFEAEQLLVVDFGIANAFRITAPVGKQLPLRATAAGKVKSCVFNRIVRAPELFPPAGRVDRFTRGQTLCPDNPSA